MKRHHRLVIGLLAATLCLNGCYGSFNLTRQVYRWNSQVGDKWPREFMFLILTWVPVYGVATAADGIIFNSVVFWTGKNMLDAKAGGVQTKRIVRKNSETLLFREGNELGIEQYQHGQQVASLRMHREGDGMAAYDAKGVKLFSASTRPDGTIVVADAGGKQVASYSGEQAQRMRETAQR